MTTPAYVTTMLGTSAATVIRANGAGVWWTDAANRRIGRLTGTTVIEWALPRDTGTPVDFALTSDGALWYTSRTPDALLVRFSEEVGPQGTPGAPGTPGAAGHSGYSGRHWRHGRPRRHGATGATGATGRPGATGDPGDPGATGPAGSAGRRFARRRRSGGCDRPARCHRDDRRPRPARQDRRGRQDPEDHLQAVR